MPAFAVLSPGHQPDGRKSIGASAFLATVLALSLMALSTLVACRPSEDRTVTPSEVNQVVDAINVELALMVASNRGRSGLARTQPPAMPPPRQPRHVIQKAREVLLKVQALRALNGLPENPVPPFPVTEATPADSKHIVDAVLHDLIELREKFGITMEAPPPPLLPDKSPTDVYANLQLASDTLDTLGIPRTMPRDVCRVAVMVLDELGLILSARRRPLPPDQTLASSGMVPRDNVDKAFEVLEHLQRKVAAEPSLWVPGGIVPPERRIKGGPAVPADVLEVLNDLLAELGAIKAALGVTTPTAVPPISHGKTPSDTYDLLARALVLVDAL